MASTRSNWRRRVLQGMQLGFTLTAFFVCLGLYRAGLPLIAGAVAPGGDWLSSPSLLLLERVLYGLIFVLPFWILIRFVLPPPDEDEEGGDVPQSLWLRSPAGEAGDASKERRGALLLGAATGLGLAVFAWGFAQLAERFGAVGASAEADRLAELLRNDPRLLVLHLGATALLTAVLEELLYRGLLQRRLEAAGLPAAFAALASAALFAGVHAPGAWSVAFGCGLGFAVLFWRRGLAASIVAHAVYNALLLLATRAGL